MDLREIAEAADTEAAGHGDTSMGRWLAHVAAECRAGAAELDAARATITEQAAEIERLRAAGRELLDRPAPASYWPALSEFARALDAAPTRKEDR